MSAVRDSARYWLSLARNSVYTYQWRAETAEREDRELAKKLRAASAALQDVVEHLETKLGEKR